LHNSKTRMTVGIIYFKSLAS